MLYGNICIKSCPIRMSGRLLGGDVREACEEKREKARDRGWIDRTAFSMRYYAAAVLHNAMEKALLRPPVPPPPFPR